MANMESSIRKGVKPFLRWAGSKRQLIPRLLVYWSDEYSNYVEPFVGSGSLFFALRPSNAILGDINDELMFTYKQVRENLDAVLSALHKFDTGRDAYLKIRSLDQTKLPAAMRAARFIYLNRYCFNGLYRTNLNGQFNVPYGAWKSGALPSREHFQSCSKALENAVLVTGSFEKTLELVKEGDFVYMDPPFSVHARRVFSEYDPSTFTSDQVRVLRQWLERLNDSGISFLVSYAESQEADLLRQGFNSHEVTVRRNISGFASKRRKARELLITNCETIDQGG
jgi:DNA adenine methylase